MLRAVIILNNIYLSVILLSYVTPSVTMLRNIRQNATMLSAMALPAGLSKLFFISSFIVLFDNHLTNVLCEISSHCWRTKRTFFFKNFARSCKTYFSVKTTYHVRYLSHLVLQVGSSNRVHKTRIHSIQRWRRHFGAKTNRSAFLLEKWLHPFLYWIRYS